MEGFIGTRMAARYLSISPSRLYALENAGKVPSHRIGEKIVYLPEELKEWVLSGKAANREEAKDEKR